MWQFLLFVVTAIGLIGGLIYYKSHPAPPSEAALRSFYSNRVVWITGASSGIGRSLALRLAELGCLLILSGRDQNALDRIKRLCEDRRPRTLPPLTATSAATTYAATGNSAVVGKGRW